LALPAEPPASVLDLAWTFGATIVITSGGNGVWPAVVDTAAPMSECFDEIDVGAPPDPLLADAIEGTRVFRIVCP
ncbi:MAG TPA: hypothetical protein VFO73_05765, partial [Candidatus Limnocylindrales bacterium]|nr:hypothetical protein [Candidatus Limnocylindrales bacterium]